jgi:hypothetical protein
VVKSQQEVYKKIPYKAMVVSALKEMNEGYKIGI